MSEEILCPWSAKLEEVLDRHHVRATIILVVASWMLYEAQKWGFMFAASSDKNGVEIAAILAAVQVPATFYAGWAFKIWAENKE